MRIKLNRNGWHRRLQNYVFNTPSHDVHFDLFNNFCPYFWLTMFCVVVVPFIFIFRKAHRFVKLFARGVGYTLDLSIARPLLFFSNHIDRFFINRMSPLDIVQAYQDDSSWFYRWKLYAGSEWSTLFRNYEAIYYADQDGRIKRERELRDKKAKRLIKRQILMRKIATWSQKLFPVFALIVLGLVGYALIRFGGWFWLVLSTDWQKTLRILLSFGIMLLGILCSVGLVAGLKHFINARPRLSNGGYEKQRIVRRAVTLLWTPFGLFFEFVTEYLKVAKENYCPAIEWQADDTSTKV